jgi:hypothetical protein
MFSSGGPSGWIGWEHKFTTFHVIKNKSWSEILDGRTTSLLVYMLKKIASSNIHGHI